MQRFWLLCIILYSVKYSLEGAGVQLKRSIDACTHLIHDETFSTPM